MRTVTQRVSRASVTIEGELRCQIGQGLLVLGDDEEARGVLVEAVDDPRARRAADAAQVGAVEEKGVDERPRVVAGGRVDDETRRLVDEDDVRVLVDDVERDVLGFGVGRQGWRHGD